MAQAFRCALQGRLAEQFQLFALLEKQLQHPLPSGSVYMPDVASCCQLLPAVAPQRSIQVCFAVTCYGLLSWLLLEKQLQCPLPSGSMCTPAAACCCQLLPAVVPLSNVEVCFAVVCKAAANPPCNDAVCCAVL